MAVSLVLKVYTSCSTHINKDLALLSRNCQQLDEVELDIVVLSQLQALRTNPDQPLPERSLLIQLSNTTFYFHKLHICLELFLFVHSIGHCRFKSLQHCTIMTKLASFPEFMVTLINAFQATLVLRKMYNVLCHSLIQLPMYVYTWLAFTRKDAKSP